MPIFKDLSGTRFGRLVVLCRVANTKSYAVLYRCMCDCGNVCVTRQTTLKNGGTKSCGCLRNEVQRNKYIDLTGKVYGRLTAVRKMEYSKSGKVTWEVKCACGNVSTVNSSDLTSGNTKSCGCYNRDRIETFIDLTGTRFGRLVVISHSKKVHRSDGEGNLHFWNVLCDCGTVKEVGANALRSGDTTSCGCYHSERTTQANTTHGMSKTPEYNRFLAKKRRDKELLYDTEWTLSMENLLRSVFPTCVVCGMGSEEHYSKYKKSLHVDHVNSLYSGAGLKPGNAVILCQHCNSVKNNRDLDSLPSSMRESILTAAALFKEAWDNYVPEVYEETEFDDDAFMEYLNG